MFSVAMDGGSEKLDKESEGSSRFRLCPASFECAADEILLFCGCGFGAEDGLLSLKEEEEEEEKEDDEVEELDE